MLVAHQTDPKTLNALMLCVNQRIKSGQQNAVMNHEAKET